jgi:hypothetical protein
MAVDAAWRRHGNRFVAQLGLKSLKSVRHGRIATRLVRTQTKTRLRREFGVDVAWAVVGHASPDVTAIPAVMDLVKSAEAMREIG